MIQNNRFTTQNQIARDSGVKNPDVNICSSLANHFAKDRLNGKKYPDFIYRSASEIYEEASKTHNKQLKLFKEGYDGPNIAFKNKIYKATKFIRTPTDEEFSEALNKHNLITYPVSEGKWPTYHQVYFGEDGKNNQGEEQCTLFDASIQGGIKESPCNQLKNELYEFSKQCLDDKNDNSYVKVASSDGTPLEERVNPTFNDPQFTSLSKKSIHLHRILNSIFNINNNGI